MIQLGVNSLLFKQFDFETAAEHIALCGYDGVEIAAVEGMCEHLAIDAWRDQAKAVQAAAHKHHLALLSMEYGAIKDESRLEKALHAASEIGIPIVNVGPGGRSDVEEDMQRSIDRLQRMSEKAAALGVVLCAKPHTDQSVYNTPTALRALAGIASSGFGLDMDLSHIYRAGENPETSVIAVLGRLKHVHMRDCKGRDQGAGTIGQQACGRGDIDLFHFCKALVDGKYDGPVVLEVIGAKPEHSLARISIVAAESYGYLNACLKQLQAR